MALFLKETEKTRGCGQGRGLKEEEEIGMKRREDQVRVGAKELKSGGVRCEESP